MTKAEAIAKWKQAASVSADGIRDGNWEPVERAMRHCSGDGDEIVEVSPNVVKVTVNKENARGPFLLVVS